jgi:cytoskeletal protein CcmA (bactofilin family)
MAKRKVSAVTGFLDRETSVVGELRVSGHLRLDGEFHGHVAVEGTLFVGETAEIHADITAHAVDVHGRITGTVVARDRLDLRRSGRIRGDIETAALVIEDGGVLVGQSRMGADRADAGGLAEGFPGSDETSTLPSAGNAGPA